MTKPNRFELNGKLVNYAEIKDETRELFNLSKLFPNHDIVGRKIVNVGVAARLLVTRIIKKTTFYRKDLNKDEKWLLAAKQANNTVKKVITKYYELNPETDGNRIIARLPTCYPAGYIWNVENKSNLYHCNSPICVHCHARCAAHYYLKLLKSFNRKPKDSNYYIGVVSSGVTYDKNKEVTDTKDWARKWFAKRLTAGGVAFRYRAYKNKKYYWNYKLIVVSNSKEQLMKAGVKKIRQINQKYDLIHFIVNNFNYPKVWVYHPHKVYLQANLLKEYEKQRDIWRFYSFGTCADYYHPGMSWSDFEGVTREA